MKAEGRTDPRGELGLVVLRANGKTETIGPGGSLGSVPMRHLKMAEVAYHGAPRKGLPDEVNAWRERNFPRVLRQAWRIAAGRRAAHRFGLLSAYGRLALVVIRANGDVLDYGLASLRVVTNNGVGFIVDAFQNLVELENMKFHGLGTNNTAEAAGDSALGTELTTQYNPDNTRATGSTTENASNIYRTVGTNTVDATAAVVEHGILSQSATGGGVLLDRSVFSTINLASGDGIQSTYDLTFTSGG